jgi:hypothetical protein
MHSIFFTDIFERGKKGRQEDRKAEEIPHSKSAD